MNQMNQRPIAGTLRMARPPSISWIRLETRPLVTAYIALSSKNGPCCAWKPAGPKTRIGTAVSNWESQVPTFCARNGWPLPVKIVPVKRIVFVKHLLVALQKINRHDFSMWCVTQNFRQRRWRTTCVPHGRPGNRRNASGLFWQHGTGNVAPSVCVCAPLLRGMTFLLSLIGEHPERFGKRTPAVTHAREQNTTEQQRRAIGAYITQIRTSQHA